MGKVTIFSIMKRRVCHAHIHLHGNRTIRARLNAYEVLHAFTRGVVYAVY
jgi:hypothetical protein